MNHIFSTSMWEPPDLPLEEIGPADKVFTFERRQWCSGHQGTSNYRNVRSKLQIDLDRLKDDATS